MFKQMNICPQANKFLKIKILFYVSTNETLVVEKFSRLSHNPMKNLSFWRWRSNFRNPFPIRIFLEPIITPRYLGPWNIRTSCDSEVIISRLTNTFKGPLNKSFQTSLRMDQYKRYRTISCLTTAHLWLKLFCLVQKK